MAGNRYDRIRLGVSSLVWGFDLSPQDQMEWFLREASEIGYEGMLVFEASVMPWLDRPAEFRSLLGRYGMDMAGVILRPNIDYGTTERLTVDLNGGGIIASEAGATIRAADLLLPE